MIEKSREGERQGRYAADIESTFRVACHPFCICGSACRRARRHMAHPTSTKAKVNGEGAFRYAAVQ